MASVYGRESMESTDLLIVDDDSENLGPLVGVLRSTGYSLDIADSPQKARKMMSEKTYGVVVLDVYFDKGRLTAQECDGEINDGISLLKWIRLSQPSNRDVPVMMMSNMEGESVIAKCFHSGANQYLPKSMSLKVKHLTIMSAIGVANRLAKSSGAHATVLRSGDYEIDMERQSVSYKNKPLHLTKCQFRILREFFKNPGVVRKKSIMSAVYSGTDSRRPNNEKVLDVHIFHLRSKLPCPNHIRTVWGNGYEFDPSIEVEATKVDVRLKTSHGEMEISSEEMRIDSSKCISGESSGGSASGYTG